MLTSTLKVLVVVVKVLLEGKRYGQARDRRTTQVLPKLRTCWRSILVLPFASVRWQWADVGACIDKSACDPRHADEA